jgi:hypothetical protein
MERLPEQSVKKPQVQSDACLLIQKKLTVGPIGYWWNICSKATSFKYIALNSYSGNEAMITKKMEGGRVEQKYRPNVQKLVID